MTDFEFVCGERVRTPSGTGTVVGFTPFDEDAAEPVLAAVWVELDQPRNALFPREWFTEHEQVVRLEGAS